MRARTSSLERWRGLHSTRHLGRRLLILYAITAAVVAAVFSTSLLASWVDTLTVLTASQRGLRTHEALSALQSSEKASTLLLLDYLVSGDQVTLARYREATAARQVAVDRLTAALGEGTAATARPALQAGYANLDRTAERAIDTRGTAPPPVALAQWQAESPAVLDDLSGQLAALTMAQDAEQWDAFSEIQRWHGTTLLLTFFFASAAALLGLWVTRKVIVSITRPLEALASAATAIGAGNLDTRVAPGLSVEFDMLGGVMNRMATQLAASRDELQAALAATERRNHELRLLSEVGDALDSSLDLDAIVDRSLDVVLASFGLRAGAIVLYGEAGEVWRWREFGRAALPVARPTLQARLRGVLGGPVLEGGGTLVLDGAAPPGDDAQGAEVPRLVVVPLEAAVRTHGVLALVAGAAWSPDERDCALLEQVGGQIARAIENVQLYAAEKGRSAEAGMLAQMAQLTSGTLDLDRLARLIARYSVNVLGVDRCIIGFFDPRGEVGGRGLLQRLYQYGFQPQQATLVEDERENLQAIVRRHMLEGQALVVPDVRLDERQEVLDLARRLDARSFISVPLVARERRVGLIYLDTREPRQHSFGPQDQRILAAIADQAAAAIDGARLFEAERRSGAQLRVLNQTSQEIAATSRLDELFARVARTIREALGYHRVRIGLIDGDDLVFEAGWSTGDTAGERLPLDGESEAARAIAQAPPRAVAIDRGGMAGLIVPLHTKEAVIGVLEVTRAAGARAGRIDADDERLLLSLGDQLGIAVEKSRLQERALSLAVVEERNRLARDLHDSVTQALFSMTLTIEAARLLLRRDTDAAEQQLANLRERAQETLAEMRGLIYSLRPAELEDQGLVTALKRWGERVRHEHLLPVEVVVDGATRLRLGEAQERELFRIAQEGLNNVVKHAGATRATIRLRATPAAIVLLIEDDGQGFDTTRPPRADAFGTRGMRERAALLGGDVAFDSRPGEGTRVLVTIPRAAGLAPVALERYRQATADRPEGVSAATGGD